MFIRSRNDVLSAITQLRKSVCAYDGGYVSDPTTCDCKYGFNNDNQGNKWLRDHGEQTGCPELRCVELLLRSMSDEDYERFMGDRK